MNYLPLIFPILLSLCSVFGSEYSEYKKELIEIRIESVDLANSGLLLNNSYNNLGIEIEKERVSKLALIDDEKIPETSEIPEFQSELFQKGKLI